MAAASSSSSTFASSNSPCAACKFLRKKCMPGCIFAPYFPPEEPHKFANVHKIFGASNVAKLLNELLPHQREDAVNSMAYEAEARVKDPVYGCVGAISVLQRQVQRLQKELDDANADLLRYACNDIIPTGLPIAPSQPTHTMTAQSVMAYQTIEHGGRSPAAFYQLQGSRMASPALWASAGSMVSSGETSDNLVNGSKDQITNGREMSSM